MAENGPKPIDTGWPLAINDQGQVLLNVDGVSVLWTAGARIELTRSDGSPIHAVTMNNWAEVVGTTGQPRRLAVWAEGRTTITAELQPNEENYGPVAINNDQQVLLNGGGTASIWDKGTLIDLDFESMSGTYVEAEAMNNAGAVVGTMDVYSSYAMAPFALGRGGLVRFAQAGNAVDINDRGDVVGVAETGELRGAPRGPWSWHTSSRWSAVWSANPLELCRSRVRAAYRSLGESSLSTRARKEPRTIPRQGGDMLRFQ